MAVADLSPIYQRDFEANLRALSQQRGSKLRACCVERNAPDMHLWDRLGALATTSRTPGGNTADTALSLTRRRSKPADFEVSNLVDPSTIAYAARDPRSDVLQGHVDAHGRNIDTIILNAALGATEDEAGGSTAYPVAQSVGGAAQAFDFNFITSVNEMFWLRNVPQDEEKVFVIRPNGARKMLQMTQATSSDYVNAQALVSKGYVENWLGYTWIVSTSPGLTNVTGLQYYYVAMTKRAIGLHITKDLWTRVVESSEKSFAWRLYSAMALGATRIEDEHVVRAHVLES
ncbi:MAG: hypothetical protein IPO00_08850 [Betaproteobacteria bacterium]|nr:hypothetical protein [Betaproteobacteria bacterium]